MATAFVSKFNTRILQFINKPLFQKVYRFSAIQTIAFAEFGQKKLIQIIDLFPFKYSINELKSGLEYIISIDKEVALSSNVMEAAVFCLVVTELLFWFFIGEVIGRRHLFGYIHLGHPVH